MKTLTGASYFEENYKKSIIYNPTCIDYFLKDSLKDAEIIKSTKKTEYYNLPCSFDIETSSFYDADDEKTAIMYEWTFGINGLVLIGRNWNDFLKLCEEIIKFCSLNENRHLIIYVHNLSYEFQFIRKRFEWLKVFAVETRKPLYATTTDGLEFRCSYLQSGYSLESLGKNLNKYHCQKMIGDLDYKKIRHAETPLTAAEIGYCINDVKVVMCYIMEQIENEDNKIYQIPLTKTGYVRRYVRNICFGKDIKDKKKRKYKAYNYRKLMQAQTIEPDEYLMLKQAFQGGFTHASPFYSGETIKDVTSMDFTSSYPAQLVKQKYPMSKGEKHHVINYDDFLDSLTNYCCLFDIEITGLQSKFLFDDYISASRCRKLTRATVDNGRVVSADFLITTITEQDFAIICEVYKWDKIRVGTMYRYYKRYLPHDFVRAVLTLYKQKTTLKGIEDEQVNYMLYKGMLNSCYGMAVTDIVRPEITYDEDWNITAADLPDALERYNESYTRFICYPVGVWCTAYARRALWKSGIMQLKEDYIYSDTDSVKYINAAKYQKSFDDYNAKNIEALEKAMYYHGFNKNEIAPETIKGIKKPLGVWDYDGHYKKFKTLGAKRYMTLDDNDNLSITVAGVNKKTTVPYLKEKYKNSFAAFTDDLIIPAAYTGKNTHTYIDDEKTGIVEDYCGNSLEYDELSAVHLEETEYSMQIADSYLNYLYSIKIEEHTT